MKHIAWLVVALVGCTDFEPIDRGVCGNGLLEDGEDCDSTAENCVSCGLTCTVATETTDCPTGFACGADGQCHAPGGTLGTQQAVGAFEVNDFRISDVDHDAFGDALGVSRSSIVVRFGDAATPLSTFESTVTPPQTGPAAFGDLDLDGSDDLSIVTLDGLVSYTSRYDRISGLEVVQTVSGPNNADAQLLSLFSIGPLTVGAFINLNGFVQLIVVDFINSDLDLGGPPCGRAIPVSEFSTADVDVYKVHRPGEAGTNTVISLVSGTGAAKNLCVTSVQKDLNTQIPTVTAVTPTNIGVPVRVTLVDVTADGDGCPSIMVPGPSQLRRWDGATTAGYCQYTTAPITMNWPASVPPGTAIVGRVPFYPEVPFSLLSPDAIVFSTGVFAHSPGVGTWGELYRSTRAITSVGHGDLDNDGDDDGALVGSGDDIEILWRTDPISPFFQGYLIDTASQPRNLVIDDFDGNGRMDVGFTEPVGERERLMVSYGTEDQPLPPLEVARFAAVQNVANIKLGSSSDYLALTSDLVVLLGGSPSKLTLLFGSTQRTMLSFFDPRSDVGNEDSIASTTIFRGQVIGRFEESSPRPEVAMLAALRAGLSVDSVGRVGMRAWSVKGTEDGLDATRTDGNEITNVDDCSVQGGMGLCVDEALYLPWAVSDTRDVVIAVDRRTQGAVFDPAKLVNNKLAATPFTLTVANKSQVRSMRASDLDGDGAKDLIITFGPAGQPSSSVLFCQVDATGTPNNCRDLVEDIVAAYPSTTACVDAAPGRFTLTGVGGAAAVASDLVVLCRDGGSTLHRVRIDADGTHVELLGRAPPGLAALQVGDVTGDQVDDVVALVGDPGSRTLVVFPQCTNRDTSCQENDQ